ncbi:MAG TPA: MFS transporter [Burkholderiaceae bacterium]|nr:MFS transporter [Burkholderiaceae bacterium]
MNDDSAAATTQERRLIVTLSLAAFGSAMSMRVADAQLPALAATFGVGLAGAAQVITVFSVAYGLLQLAYGPFGDRHGKWRVVTLAVLASAATAFACAVASDFTVLLVARAAAGATCAGIIPLSMAWIGDAVAYERRQPVLARFLTGQIAGMASGQWLGGVASDYFNWRVPFALLTACFLLSGVLLWRMHELATVVAPHVARSGRLLREARYVLREPWARVVLCVVFLEGAILYGPFAFLATHFHLQTGVSLAAAGALVTLFALGGLLFALASRRLVPRLGESGLARGGGALILFGLLFAAWSPWWWTAPLACVAAGLGFYMFHNTLQTNATQMAPQARGLAVSLFAAGFFLGQTSGVAVAALAVERFGTQRVLAAGAAGVLVVAFAFARLRTRRGTAG